MIHIRSARIEDARLLASLADTIWREHYIPIIGKPQVDYMLETFQSETAIADQIRRGTRYFILEWEGSPAGYYAFEVRGEELFLSKIYVLETHRGRGMGRAALKAMRERANACGCSRIALTVNKDNSPALAAYERLGFFKEQPSITDIGGGFVMDDYRMVLPLSTPS